MKFLSNNQTDYGSSLKGDRIDGRNLIEEWHQIMEKKNLKHKFIWNISDFHDLKPNQFDHILGKTRNMINKIIFLSRLIKL